MEGKQKPAIIIISALIAIIGGIYVLQNEGMKTPQDQPTTEQNIEFNPIGHKNNDGAEETLTEQINKEKFSEYLSEAYLSKIPVGGGFDPLKAVNAKLFSPKDQFCTFLNVKKTIPANRLSWTFYDANSKKDLTERNITPVEITAENNFGCTDLTYPAGKYEQRIYIDNILVITLPFEIKQE